MMLVDHLNLLKSHCSFVSDHNLWVVMPYMSGGSCLHILKAAYPDGFEEVIIATILREALKGLDYLHQHGHIHRDVKVSNFSIIDKGKVLVSYLIIVCFRRGIFYLGLVVRSSWEILVYLLVSLIQVIGNARGTHLLEHLAGMF